ncbi:hypothetical protein BS78_05G092900 [Paspalum vaginatum]|nr:hypothetical protein BS78_05G092900 [Paspalum vaginatum]KAJ1274867.1 hypothetical protein BS78_05G092900 [Paspalum vaginatum]
MAFSVDRFVLDDLPLVSQHLTSLDLSFVRLHSTTCLNLSRCPALEHLELVDCDLSTAKQISSESLKHLNLSCCLFDEHSRACICTPGLVSLRLDEPCGMTPVLDSVPSLLEAFFETVDDDSFMGGDICDRRMDNLDCCCRLCDSSDITVSGRRSVLLEGLSQAKSLVLISGPNQIIIKSDLRWCPMFGKLKTLLLNDCWCEPDDFDALACILEHSPVLEKLTLELFDLGPKFKVEMKGSFNLMARSDKISEHLSIVKVKCQDVGDKVLKVLKFLGTFNIGTFWQSPCFSFKRVENILKHVFCVDCLSYFNRFHFLIRGSRKFGLSRDLLALTH